MNIADKVDDILTFEVYVSNAEEGSTGYVQGLDVATKRIVEAVEAQAKGFAPISRDDYLRAGNKAAALLRGYNRLTPDRHREILGELADILKAPK